MRGLDFTKNMDEASAFLDIASILVEAKSVAILPGGEDSQHDEQSLEVLRERDLLFARLLQYRAYKQAAGDFRARIAANSGRFPHPAAMDEGVAAMLPELVWTLTPLELARLTAQVIANAPASEVSSSISCTCRWSICGPNRWWCATGSIGGIGIQGRPVDIVQRIDPGLHFSYRGGGSVHGRARVLQTRCAAVSARWSVCRTAPEVGTRRSRNDERREHFRR